MARNRSCISNGGMYVEVVMSWTRLDVNAERRSYLTRQCEVEGIAKMDGELSC